MEKLIVSPGFVKKIEDEQDTQDQAITSNSTAIANINGKITVTSPVTNVNYYPINNHSASGANTVDTIYTQTGKDSTDFLVGESGIALNIGGVNKWTIKGDMNANMSLQQYLKQTTNAGATLTFTTSENRYTALVFVTSNDASNQSGVFAVRYKQNSIGSVTKLAGGNDIVSCDQTNGTLSVAVGSWSLVVVLTTGKMA